MAEQSKSGFYQYAKERLTGFEFKSLRSEERPLSPSWADEQAFPEWAEARQVGGTPTLMVCTGPINYVGMAAVQTDIENFKAALQDVQPQEAFIPAASPGILAQGSRIRNEYYPTTDAFLEALAQAMRQEYQAIVQAGFLLQVDSPDLADLRTMRFWDLSLEAYRKKAAQHVEVLNAAL